MIHSISIFNLNAIGFGRARRLLAQLKKADKQIRFFALTPSDKFCTTSFS